MKIAIVRLSALGDIIQSAIVLQFIKAFKADIEIHWCVDEKFKEILSDHRHIDRIYALPLKEIILLPALTILLEARKNNYDAVLDLQGLIKSALVSRILSYNTFGFDKNSLRESLAHNFYNQKLSISYNENVFVRYLSLAAFALNAPFEPREIHFKRPLFVANPTLKEELQRRLNLNFEHKNILIHTGSSVENKIYPQTRLAILCKLLIAYDAQIRIFLAWGSEGEKKFAQELMELGKMDQDRLVLLPRLSLQELIALTKMMRLIIGNDSGPTHLAFAMNRPSITIFGASWDKRVCLLGPQNKSINAGKKFNKNKNFKFDKSDFCIRRIDEEEIFALAKDLLDEG